jgi:hypothetical protein
MRRAFYCIIQIYNDNKSSMDPVLLSDKKDNRLCHGGNFLSKNQCCNSGCMVKQLILAKGIQNILWNKN